MNAVVVGNLLFSGRTSGRVTAKITAAARIAANAAKASLRNTGAGGESGLRGLDGAAELADGHLFDSDDVERLKDLGVRAIKFHPPHQEIAANAYRHGLPALADMYGRAEELGMPVMVHTGTSIFPGARNRYADPMAADDVAVDFPRLPIVLAHAGRPLYMTTAVFLARRHPNVRLDLSGIPPRKLLEYLPRLEEISDRCLWGTDFPSPGIASMRRNVDDFLTLPLTDGARRKILFDNSAALLG